MLLNSEVDILLLVVADLKAGKFFKEIAVLHEEETVVFFGELQPFLPGDSHLVPDTIVLVVPAFPLYYLKSDFN